MVSEIRCIFFYIRLSLIPSTQCRVIGVFCAGASKGRQTTLTSGISSQVSVTHTSDLPDLLWFAIIVMRCFIILVTQIVLQVLPHFTARSFLLLWLFFWALWKEMFMSGRLCRCDDHTVTHFGCLCFQFSRFFTKPLKLKKAVAYVHVPTKWVMD